MTKVLMFIGLVSAISTALVGQAHLIGEPYNHYLTIIGVISSTTVAYFMQPPRDSDRRDRVSDQKIQELNNGPR